MSWIRTRPETTGWYWFRQPDAAPAPCYIISIPEHPADAGAGVVVGEWWNVPILVPLNERSEPDATPWVAAPKDAEAWHDDHAWATREEALANAPAALELQTGDLFEIGPREWAGVPIFSRRNALDLIETMAEAASDGDAGVDRASEWLTDMLDAEVEELARQIDTVWRAGLEHHKLEPDWWTVVPERPFHIASGRNNEGTS